MELGYLDGQFMATDEMKVSGQDRGYLFGDGVYEVTRVFNGELFCYTLHRDRLFRSLKEMKMAEPVTREELESLHRQLIEKSGIKDGFIYMQITRGVAPRNHSFYNKNLKPVLMMYIKAFPDAYVKARDGVKAITHIDERWLRCDIKSLNLIPNSIAQSAADEKGAYSAILFRDGICTEGAASNVFVVKDGVLYTHPANNFILNGCTRQVVINKVAQEEGVKVVEKEFDKDFLMNSDEVFFTSSLGGILPILEVDGKIVGDGKVGPTTMKLQNNMIELLEKGFF